MKILSLFLTLALQAASQARTISKIEDLGTLSEKSDSIFSIKIIANRNPWIEIVSVWKKNKGITDEIIAKALNRYIDESRVLTEPVQSKSMLLFMSSGRISTIDIDHKSLVIGNHLLPLEDAKRIVRKTQNTAEQGAAANP